MAQLSRVHIAITEDLGLLLSTYIEQLTTAYNSSSGESDALFWSLRAPLLTCAHTPHTDTDIHN